MMIAASVSAALVPIGLGLHGQTSGTPGVLPKHAQAMVNIPTRFVLLLCLGLAVMLTACGGDEPDVHEAPQTGDACISDRIAHDEDGVGRTEVLWYFSAEPPAMEARCLPGDRGASVDYLDGPMESDKCHAGGAQGVVITAWDLRESADMWEREVRCVPYVYSLPWWAAVLIVLSALFFFVWLVFMLVSG